jgi:acyl carrier protein
MTFGKNKIPRPKGRGILFRAGKCIIEISLITALKRGVFAIVRNNPGGCMDNQEQELAEIRRKLKEFIVTGLSLEGVKPEEIKDDTVLFGEGLGLDSLDAVEIVVILQRNWGVDVKDMNEGRKAFYSIDTVANYIYDHLKK